ncbi:MAG: major capsid protein [Microviridae sp.]|nr:MAG: major capsid protein [Microviridae sp.]
MPGDTFNVKTHKLVRLQTPIAPFVTPMWMDTYYFFVPNRLVWKHWKEFQGENTESAWLPQTTYEVPQIKAPAGGWSVGTIADYMGIPIGVSDISVNALPFRAYAKVMDYFFRNQALQDPFVIPDNETLQTGSNGSNFVTDVANGGKPWIARRYNDYFSQALPAPQKGPSVTLPLFSGGTYPVVGNGNAVGFVGKNSDGVADTLFGTGFSATASALSLTLNDNALDKAQGTQFANGHHPAHNTVVGVTSDPSKSGLVANVSGDVQGVTINELRAAFQLQKYYEQLARSGSRYSEVLKAQFHVDAQDYRLQNPEYLGGSHVSINVSQVVQNSATGADTTPQGNMAAYSLTTDSHHDFVKSFVEHGFVIGVCVVRYEHSYQQGIERFWSRKKVTDYYLPVFANLGEQAILNKEIYAQGSSAVDGSGNPYDEQVFGYVPRWNEYRFKPNRITGEMRSSYKTSLDVWHLGDDYSQRPVLSDEWLREDKDTVDRVIAVSNRVNNQLFGDFYIENTTTRAMPLHSIPGLIDHH